MDLKRKLDDTESSGCPKRAVFMDDSKQSTKFNNYDKLLSAVCNQSGVRGKLIIYSCNENENPLVTLQNSLAIIELQCRVERNLTTMKFDFLIGDEVICSDEKGEYDNKQSARLEMAKQAFSILSKDCFVLHKKRDYTDVTEKDLQQDIGKPTTSHSNFNKPGSMAHKMMMKMGWGGGGLGSQEQGQVENVQVYENIERRGFGNKNILKEVTRILREFADSNKFTILAFDPTFTKSEREIIHKTARRLNLKSKSEGKGEERRITVSRKINRYEIVTELLKVGGENTCYKLEIPKNFASLFGD